MSSQDEQTNPSGEAASLGDLQLGLDQPNVDAIDRDFFLMPNSGPFGQHDGTGLTTVPDASVDLFLPDIALDSQIDPQLDLQLDPQLLIPPQPAMPAPMPLVSQSQASWPRLPPPPEIAAFLNPRHTPINHGRVPDRRGNKDTTVANDFYYSIAQLPALLLPRCRRRVTYRGAEFESNVKFTADEFREYLHCASRRPNGMRWPILRIQIQPTQYNHRYARGSDSHKCRFRHCADQRGTILKGQARVCIQEFDDAHGDWLNPFHNAGYVHLYCLEQQLNLIELYHSPDVRIVVDDRRFKHEPAGVANPRLNNPMCLNEVEKEVVWRWLQWTGHRWGAFIAQHPDPQQRPLFQLGQQDQLCHRLTKAHIETSASQQGCATRNVDAAGRPTAQLTDYVGDLHRHASMREHMLAEQRQNRADKPTRAKRARASSPAQEPPQKRRRHARQGPFEQPLMEYTPAFARPANRQDQPPHAQAFHTPVSFPLQSQVYGFPQAFHTPVSFPLQSQVYGFPQSRPIFPEAPAVLPRTTAAQPSIVEPRQLETSPPLPAAGDCIGDPASPKNNESHAAPAPVDGGAEERRQSSSSAPLEEVMLDLFGASDEPPLGPGAGLEAGAEACAGASDCVMEEV